MSKDSAFQLNQRVSITATGQVGVVMGKAQYAHLPNDYLIHYVNSHGDLAREWLNGCHLQTVEEPAAA